MFLAVTRRTAALFRALETGPGTLADDLGCLAALGALCVTAYALLVLA